MDFLTVELIVRVVAVLAGMVLARFYVTDRVSHLKAILQALAVLLLGSIFITALARLEFPQLLVDAIDLIVAFAAGWAYGRHRLDTSIFSRD